MTTIIQGREPGATAFGTVDHLQRENAEADAADKKTRDHARAYLANVAQNRLRDWKAAAIDIKGAFSDWDFRLLTFTRDRFGKWSATIER